MFYIPENIVDYKALKGRLIKHLIILDIIAVIALWMMHPAFLPRYVMGAILGLGYLFSLFFSTEFPERRLAIGLSIVRMSTVSFLIVMLGEFKLLETCVVFCGFLSYKLVLVLEFVRYSIGIKFNSGK